MICGIIFGGVSYCCFTDYCIGFYAKKFRQGYIFSHTAMQDKWDTIESNGTLVPSIDFFLFEKLIQAKYPVVKVS